MRFPAELADPPAVRREGGALRLLVTGSRNWADRDVIDDALWDWLIDHGYTAKTVSQMPAPVLVVGACPSGADKIAEDLWRERGFPVERHVADWRRHGRSAGPKRNAAMVASGVDACLAFPLGESRGTRGCMEMARQAGVPVTVVEG